MRRTKTKTVAVVFLIVMSQEKLERNFRWKSRLKVLMLVVLIKLLLFLAVIFTNDQKRF